MSAIKIADNYISEFEYLEGEKISEIRHEYIDGEVFAMAGSSVQHNRIAMNIANFIYNEADAKGGNCEVFTSDIKVGIKSRKSIIQMLSLAAMILMMKILIIKIILV
jgi:Uma2 family endonuclease